VVLKDKVFNRNQWRNVTRTSLRTSRRSIGKIYLSVEIGEKLQKSKGYIALLQSIATIHYY